MTTLPAQAVLIASKALTKSQGHHVRARKRSCPQQQGCLCPLEMSGGIRASRPLQGDAVSPYSGMAPRGPGAQQALAHGLWRHEELSAVRAVAKSSASSLRANGTGVPARLGGTG